MSMRSSLRAVFGIAGVAGWLASPAAAVPLTYNVVVDESDIFTSASVSAYVDVTPDLTELLPPIGDDFPMFGGMQGTSNTKPASSSYAIADVGLPGNFGGGITISELTFTTLLAPGVMDGFGLITVPLDLTGSSLQLIAYQAKIASLTITLDSPGITSALTPLGPGEWAWAGTANATISGILAPTVAIPTVDTITLGPYPFSQAVTLPFAGTFSGDENGTVLTLGIPIDTLQNQSLELPTISQQIDLLDLGLVTATFNMSALVLADFSAAVVYANSTPIPEPNTAALLALGLVGIALRRRRSS